MQGHIAIKYSHLRPEPVSKVKELQFISLELLIRQVCHCLEGMKQSLVDCKALKAQDIGCYPNANARTCGQCYQYICAGMHKTCLAK